MTRINFKVFRERLDSMRREVSLNSQITEVERQPVTLDQSMVGRLSRMDAMQSQAMAIETERRRSIEIKRIDAALERINEGEFGYCGICGELINSKRLENDPTVVACITCARNTQ